MTPARSRRPAHAEGVPQQRQSRPEAENVSFPSRRRPGHLTSGLPPISEKQFAQQVVDLAGLLGWRVYRTWRSAHSPAGFPDVCMVRRPRIVWAELKRDGGKVTAAQAAWIDELRACGQEVHLWTPALWSEIERILSP